MADWIRRGEEKKVSGDGGVGDRQPPEARNRSWQKWLVDEHVGAIAKN